MYSCAAVFIKSPCRDSETVYLYTDSNILLYKYTLYSRYLQLRLFHYVSNARGYKSRGRGT